MVTGRVLNSDPIQTDWLRAIEERLLDMRAAHERAVDDRIFAEQVESETARELRDLETLWLELAFELVDRDLVPNESTGEHHS